MPNTEIIKITDPDSDQLNQLCDELRAMSSTAQFLWPREQLKLCGRFGVYEWFLPPEFGGQGWTQDQIVQGYLKLSASCLTTTFVITQYMGACRRIAASTTEGLAASLLPDMVSGEKFSTVGISHLTTSRRHLAKPVLAATEVEGGFILNGFSPWVTGGAHADSVVVGATLDDGRQILAVVETHMDGVSAPEPPRLVGLTGSQTGRFDLDNVFVSSHLIVGGPVENIMQSGVGAQVGGLQTSTLAGGLATAAIDFLFQEAKNRPELLEPTERLAEELNELRSVLAETARGSAACSLQELRVKSNSLALRSTQAALAAAKGSGYIEGHPAGRWCQEALFFLVWSCPQPVLNANLCELAGIQ
ncbi:MAG: acyl-CoA/acyl-ACP dehydrogenase [Planctomycetales bacterium]|nr:acyl-CoA/acyl-ACP dehydrogenase [Planctomycetales bacterium]